MTSISNTPTTDTVLLDAARECLLAVGWRRTTMTDVARRAGVSRMTVYRRWPDLAALSADLMTREWADVGARLIGTETPTPTATVIATGVAHAAAEIHSNELFRKIVEVDPELVIPYLFDRRGRSSDALIDSLVTTIEAAQAAGTVRRADPLLLARSILLTAYGFTFSVPTMVDENHDASDYFDQLRLLVEGYLR
ncbi:TetR/AcrR family transcriptional regulator [Rudaeicoccus suwonensis]|uniref:TetR family transcriptional regulator n=1 Tax=Rudaeicoccus suwonensis TaxID=657409 RepID=A0A561E7D5_9MICO|nr:TetR/AcrR family transcriptional regulator [Rudaeicoccus suwonensis]TWE11535.1 TetR family transcriptional regulator [Rudaeicoccus suwonensis]